MVDFFISLAQQVSSTCGTKAGEAKPLLEPSPLSVSVAAGALSSPKLAALSGSGVESSSPAGWARIGDSVHLRLHPRSESSLSAKGA